MYKLTDVNRQSIWVNPTAVTAIVIPSPLDPKNAQSQVLMGMVAFVVSEAEATALLQAIHTGNPNGYHP